MMPSYRKTICGAPNTTAIIHDTVCVFTVYTVISFAFLFIFPRFYFSFLFDSFFKAEVICERSIWCTSQPKLKKTPKKFYSKKISYISGNGTL